MRKIIIYLSDYLKTNFSWKLYVSLGLYIALIISFDYTIQFQKNVLYRLPPVVQWPAFTLFYASFYLGASAIVSYFRPTLSVFKNLHFWLFTFLIFGILGFYKSFSAMADVCELLPPNYCRYSRKVARYIFGFATIFLPTFLLYAWQKNKADTAGMFGVNREKFDWAPYAWMLLIMIPLIGAASFQDSFIRYYPNYKKAYGHILADQLQIAEWPLASLFEIAYALSFINVELFFRGLLIWAMVRFLKEDVVLPMIAVYATFHFVKPLGETISSVFGGFILGVISLKSRSIWGGIFIHVSIAWLMELFAWLQNLPKQSP